MPTIASSLAAQREYFDSGITRSYSFRKEQLTKLKQALLDHEQEIYVALNTDLKKNPEETWVTETGMVIAEINAALKNLRRWMRPERKRTNLANLPSSSKVMKEPLGVVLVIGPWNYPLMLILAPVVGAIAAGNCVVIKPSEFSPATTNLIGKIMQSRFPPEYITVVEGEGAELIPDMMENFRFDHVFYTGSTNVGKIIYKMAADKLVPVTLELGGKSPCVVEADAHINVSARRIVVTKFSNAGQMCVASDYLLVHESVKEKFVVALKKAITDFYGEDPSVSYDYCKIINEKQFDRLTGYLEGAHILHGGRQDRQRLYIEPTLIDQVELDSGIMKEEIFGPILPVIGFSDREEARKIIEKNPNPLAFYLFTSSSDLEKQWLNGVAFGGACVNNNSWHLTNHHLPFGGRGFSGTGNYHGKYSFDTFSHHKAVMKTPTWFDPAIKYPPMKGHLGIFKKLIR